VTTAKRTPHNFSRNRSGVSELSRVGPAQHIIGHFGDESLRAIICTGTDNTKQTGENTPKTQNKQSYQTGSSYIEHTNTDRKPLTNPKSLAVTSS